jgi:hypothetical protein
MLKTKFIIETIGEPDIQALSESEQRTFFEMLLAHIAELSKSQNND